MRICRALFTVVAMMAVACVRTEAREVAKAPAGQYAVVNGLRMYYETEGNGRPLVLVHGAFSNIDIDFGKLRPRLAKSRRVIAVELQGHGRTADIDRPLGYEQMADDVAELLTQLHADSADFLGYSMGGGVALQVAVRHPERVRKVVWFGGAAYDPSGFYPDLLETEKTMTPDMLAGTPWQKAYAQMAPNPADWAKLVDRIKTLDLNWKGFPPADLKAIKAPVLIINGD